MEYKFSDFMKELDGRLDSIHGNRGNLPENSPYLYEMDLCANASDLEKAEHMAKEKLWMIDKGESFVWDFMAEHEEEEMEGGGRKYEFEQDVRFYYFPRLIENIAMATQMTGIMISNIHFIFRKIKFAFFNQFI